MVKRRKTGARHGNSGRKRRWWRLLGLLAVGLLTATLWLIWPFWHLSGQFGTQPSKQPSRIYGRPLELRVDAALDVKTLADRLVELGYRRLDPDIALRPGTFRPRGGGLEIFRQRFPTPRGVEGGDRLRVGFENGTVATLTTGDDARQTALLDPPLIASYYGPELRERRPVSLDELPEDLILAVLAAEDANFLEHAGVSLRAILRAAWVNVTARRVRQGGSTLTQQLVKNLYLTHDRVLIRKLREAVLAVLLELRYDKRAILQAYLNEIYWGRSGHVQLMGIGAAAWAYFGKHPSLLDLSESALLAGMIQSPATLSPLDHAAAAKTRRDAVLERLAELRWLELERLETAARLPIGAVRGPLVARQAPYFAAAMEDEARRRFGIGTLDDAGYVLHATLSAGDQAAAEAAVRWGVDALETGWEKDRKTTLPLQAALVSIDPRDGAILAYVGGRDYATSQFDRVSQARRQAGSAFKPIVYAAAYAARVASPATFLEDAPLTVKVAGGRWSPENSDRKYRGWITSRHALEKSLNVPTARLALDVGLDRIVQLARRAGVRGRLDPYPAIALGAMEVTPAELATVYGTFAAGGTRPTLHGLVAIHDRQGQRVAGTPLPPPERVLDEDVCYVLNKVLQGVLDAGTGAGARSQGLTDPLAGKTGTTNSRRDSWFAGYSPRRTTLVWVGYDDNSRTKLSGARAALPIWARFTYQVRPAGGDPDFAPPPGVVRAWIDAATGGLATDRCPHPTLEVFLSDFAPRTLCREHGGFRARPLEQPDDIGPDRRRHRFRRWLDMLRGRKKAQQAI